MVIDNKYDIGNIVYLVTDTDQSPRMITAITVCRNAELVYELYCGTVSSRHYDFEMSTEKTVMV